MGAMKMTWRQWRWVVFWATNIVIIFAVWASVSLPKIGTDYTQTLLALSRLGALYAGFTLLVQLWLIGRARQLEEDFGLDRLTRIHRWNGFAAVLLVLVHVPTILMAYAPIYNVPVPQVLPLLMQNLEDITKAFIAELLLFVVAASSLVVARRRLKYQYWYYIHLASYVVIALSVGHQIAHGRELIVVPWFRAYWYILYLATASMIVYYRFFLPFWKWCRHEFRVARVVEEVPGVTSLYLRGKNMQNFQYRAGQFAKFRFVARGFWEEEHPFTISIEPNGHELRITCKNLGDFTAKLRQIPEGTPVVVDGPYGRFTLDQATQQRLVFIAGGIGITPMRAMLGELAQQGDKREVWLFYSVRNAKELALKTELERLTNDLKLKIRYVVTEGKLHGAIHELLTADMLERELGNLAKTDFYVCGPPAMMTALRSQLAAIGVPSELVHYEQFSLVQS